jgi:hypothetical protein
VNNVGGTIWAAVHYAVKSARVSTAAWSTMVPSRRPPIMLSARGPS